MAIEVLRIEMRSKKVQIRRRSNADLCHKIIIYLERSTNVLLGINKSDIKTFYL